MPTKLSVSRAWNRRGRIRPSARRAKRVGFRRRSALGEGVTGTTHRQHEGRHRRIVLDLVAQMAHMDVDRLLVLVERLVVAQQLEQLAPRVDAPGSAGEVAEDLEFGGR